MKTAKFGWTEYFSSSLTNISHSVYWFKLPFSVLDMNSQWSHLHISSFNISLHLACLVYVLINAFLFLLRHHKLYKQILHRDGQRKYFCWFTFSITLWALITLLHCLPISYFVRALFLNWKLSCLLTWNIKSKNQISRITNLSKQLWKT